MADWPIFVLTLAGDDHRRAPLMAQLAAGGLSAQLIFGVDGRCGLPLVHEAGVDRQAARQALGRDMTDGELACALSHRAIYQRIVDQDLPGAVVFEDDARLDRDLLALLRGGHHEQVPLVLFHYRYGRALRLSRKRVMPGVLFRRAAIRATSTMAYAVRRDAAETLLRHASPVAFQADWPCDLYAVGAWLTVPRLAFEDGNTASHLQDSRAVLTRMTPKAPQARSFTGWLRARLSVRVGREKGQI